MERYTPPGHLKSVDAFNAALGALDPAFAADPELLGAAGPLGRPLTVQGRTIGNRFAVHPMEGWDAEPDGMPGVHTLRRWRRFGESGAKLIWGGEAFAVQRDGRANPRQLYLNPAVEIQRGLTALRENLEQGHASTGESTDDLLVGLQLTHSGRFARPDDGPAQPRIAHHHPVLAARFDLAADHPLLTDTELEEIGDAFIHAARVAAGAGFDFVDVKCCHGYLLHELLAAHTRPGRYGGSFENRTRLFRRVVKGIRVECPGLIVGVRLSITDLFPFAAVAPGGVGARGIEAHRPYAYAFGVDPEAPLETDLDEPLRFLELLRALDIRLVNLTLGSPYYCPHAQRPATYPPSDGYAPPEDPLLSVIRHLRLARVCKKAFPDLTFVGSGYSYLQEYLPNVAQAEVGAEHVDFVGLGRMILSYPELPRDVLAGTKIQRKKLCRTFSDCTTAPRNGMISGCYPLDEHYKRMEQAVELRVLRKSRKPPGDADPSGVEDETP